MKQTNTDSLITTGRAALRAGKRAEALAVARKALRLSPNNIDALRFLADALTMRILYRYDAAFATQLAEDGSLAEAIAVRRRLAELGVEESENHLQIGYCLTCLGAFDDAAENIRRATDILAQERSQTAPGLNRSMEVMSPDFFIIGAAKCGTTSLFEYICQHPLVLSPILKEIDYFLHPERGLPWFQSHFPRRPQADIGYITGEASVSTITLARAPAELRQLNPNAKLIALARDPVDRAISHYTNNLRLGTERRSLEEAINQELDILESDISNGDDKYWKSQLGYVWLGLYANDLERWLATFPEDQLCIIITEELQAQHEQTMDHVFRFLGLPPHRGTIPEKHNSGVYDDQDQRRIRNRMSEFFERPNERFYELIGRRLNWSGKPASSTTPLMPAASKARILLGKGQWKEASEEFGKCLVAAPGHQERQEWLEQRSRALIEAKDAEGAQASLAELLQAFPDDRWAAAGLIRMTELVNDPVEKAAVLEDFIHRYPAHPNHRTWTHSLGRTLLDLKQWERAGDIFQILVAAYPEEGLGVFGLARVAEETGKLTQALALYDIYSSRFPEDPDRRWWLIIFAHLLLRQNMLARAEHVITSYRADFPEEAGGLAFLALLEQKKGNWKQAIDVWNDCLRRFPDHPDRRWWLPTITNLLIDRGELDRAEALIDESLIEFPNQPGGLVGLARVASLRGNSERAADIWEECLGRFPNHPERRWWLPTYGHSLLNTKQMERGEEQFRRALEEFPDDPIAKAGLARACNDRGHWQEAAQLLTECIGVYPGHPNRPDWENMLRHAHVHLRAEGPTSPT